MNTDTLSNPQGRVNLRPAHAAIRIQRREPNLNELGDATSCPRSGVSHCCFVLPRLIEMHKSGAFFRFTDKGAQRFA
jgi:hypothetical protein